ncbi:MAG: aminotransferase class V-fold PLP-dependent enzyme [Rhodanobacteraceae bacterium]
MHYLDNAATSWPKPEVVYQTMDQGFRQFMSAKRGTSKTSRHGAAAMDTARQALAELIHAPDPSRIVFTGGCTQSLNLVIQAFPWQPGDGIVISALEHHALSRPVRKVVREKQLELHVVPYTNDQPFDLGAYENLLRTKPNIRLVATLHASNVIGSILPVAEIGRLAKRYGKYYLLDAAQSAGVLPIDATLLNADLVALPAHKSLYGPPGIGALHVGDVPLQTFMEGGTGGDSGGHVMHAVVPGMFEVGTIPMPQIQAMSAGVQWVMETGIEQIREHETRLLQHLIDGLQGLPGLTLYGHTDVLLKTPVVSFNVDGWRPKALGELLFDRYDIALRAGFHCAPMAHHAIGTLDSGGTVRASLGYHTTPDDVDALLNALGEITHDAPRVERS